jgi:hypothetical protein
MLDAGFLELESFDIGRPADRDEYLVDGEVVIFAVGFDDEAGATAFRPGEGEVFPAADDLNPVADEGVVDDLGGIGVFAGENPGHGFDEGHLCPEPGEGLSHFTADGAGADDAEGFGELGEVKKVFVGKVIDFIEAGDGGGGGATAGGDHGFLKTELGAIDFDGGAFGEAGLAEEDIDAEVLEALGGVVVTDLGAQFADPFHDGGEIDGDAAGDLDAEIDGAFYVGEGVCGSEENLGGDAADIEAVPAEEVAFHEGDLGAEAGSSSRADESGGAATDDDEIVAAIGDGIFPIGGVGLGDEFPVVFVIGRNGEWHIRIIRYESGIKKG